ncbi:MAG: hypothetical protein AABY87_13525 [bacterium]
MKTDVLSPGKKAQRTAKWARTMTKWLISFNRQSGARWNLVDFGGTTKSESRGIVDLLAVRKNHRTDMPGLKRGDILQMVLIQTKGGSAPRPTLDDIARLKKVAKHHRAMAIVLAEWSKGQHLELYKLKKNEWVSVRPVEVFG